MYLEQAVMLKLISLLTLVSRAVTTIYMYLEHDLGICDVILNQEHWNAHEQNKTMDMQIRKCSSM